MRENLAKTLALFNKKDKKKLFIILLLMIGAALFETIGVGLMLPFVGIITNPEIVETQPIIRWIYETAGFTSHEQFVIAAVGALLTVFVIKNVYLLSFFYVQFRILLNQQVKLSSQLLKTYLRKPYTFHLQRNSSDLLRNVTAEVPKVFQGMILAVFQLLTEVLVIICIVTLLMFTAPTATMTAAGILGGSIGIFFLIFKKKISNLGTEQQRVTGTMIKWINQSLGASKDVKVSGRENFFIQAFQYYSQIKANNGRYMKMLDSAPRLFIETILVFTILITMLVIMNQGADTSELITIMALFAMAAFRLMPSITRVMALLTQIRYNKPALDIVYHDYLMENEVDTEQLKQTDLPRRFKYSIDAVNVSYYYPKQSEAALKNISLSIPIGSATAFIGESGSGKSTLMDTLLGLLNPSEGKIKADGKDILAMKQSWQRNIGYIPQFIFLSDDTILRNVAFGIHEADIDEKSVWRALEQAQLKSFVESLPDGIYTQIGERGARLSGGQRQRIGIARALYHDPQILFMDEATSALDSRTEKEIMNSINQLKGDKTIIIIAHRLSTIERCDKVYEMTNGVLHETAILDKTTG
ncbi:ABC transporter ATP-binding protein [Alkalicoccus luteus]|uniref:ABC transporter ATP-binding protein n=1 Tax=Alkalicoccus luteus TaxID=1237094 RepID=A0A969TUJ4_9BACI|nr:ABC transporter ATP-binding protein [Alkalicoccus luteus]NJP38783.1 ABC transporter ATP-binding protein [Alkalicoccus luteus]